MELCSCQELHHFGATGDTVVNQKVGKQLPPAGNRHKTTKDMKENQLYGLTSLSGGPPETSFIYLTSFLKWLISCIGADFIPLVEASPKTSPSFITKERFINCCRGYARQSLDIAGRTDARSSACILVYAIYIIYLILLL